jgi:hypothetical protein
MNHYSSSSYTRQTSTPGPSSSRRHVAQPSPSYPGGPSFMPPPPATPMHPPLPLHYRAPTAGRSFTPVTLPPLQNDGYATDGGRRERSVRLPGFSEVAGQQQRDSDPTRRRYVRVTFYCPFMSSLKPLPICFSDLCDSRTETIFSATLGSPKSRKAEHRFLILNLWLEFPVLDSN